MSTGTGNESEPVKQTMPSIAHSGNTVAPSKNQPPSHTKTNDPAARSGMCATAEGIGARSSAATTRHACSSAAIQDADGLKFTFSAPASKTTEGLAQPPAAQVDAAGSSPLAGSQSPPPGSTSPSPLRERAVARGALLAELGLWVGAGLIALTVHVGAAAWLLQDPETLIANDELPAAIMIEVADVSEATLTEQNDISPDQQDAVESTPSQASDAPQEQPTQETPEETAEPPPPDTPPEEQVAEAEPEEIQTPPQENVDAAPAAGPPQASRTQGGDTSTETTEAGTQARAEAPPAGTGRLPRCDRGSGTSQCIQPQCRPAECVRLHLHPLARHMAGPADGASGAAQNLSARREGAGGAGHGVCALFH